MMKAGLKDNRPIGVFDSGLGGLCALKELKKLLPNEHFVYFGDTGRTLSVFLGRVQETFFHLPVRSSMNAIS